MQRSIDTVFVSWLGLGAATGFFAWVVRTGPDGPGQPEFALAAYAGSLVVGLIASALVFAVIWAVRAPQWFARISYASCLLYLGFFAIPDRSMLAWVFPVMACALLGPLRRYSMADTRVPLLLIHAMGSLSGLYLSFQLRTFIASWPAFTDVLAALWLLLA